MYAFLTDYQVTVAIDGEVKCYEVRAHNADECIKDVTKAFMGLGQPLAVKKPIASEFKNK